MKFCPFWGFGAQKPSFAPKMRPWSPRRKTLYKHNVLGAFLEAQGRKNSFWGPEMEFLQNFIKFHGKSIFREKSENHAKSLQTSQNVTFFALKACVGQLKSQNDPSEAPKHQNLMKIMKFHEIR